MQTWIKSTVTPETKDKAELILMRLQALPDVIRVEQPKGCKAHTWLSARQVKRPMETCGPDLAGQRDRVVLALLVGAGLRRAELASLQWKSVKRQPVKGKVRTVIEVRGKGAKDRVVPVSDRLATILGDWPTVTGRQGYIVRSLGMAQDLGARMSAQAIFDIVRKHGKAIGMPALAPHDLRRTYAQLGYDAGVPITQISTLLGHSSIQTTQRYLNVELDLEVTISDFVPL